MCILLHFQTPSNRPTVVDETSNSSIGSCSHLYCFYQSLQYPIRVAIRIGDHHRVGGTLAQLLVVRVRGTSIERGVGDCSIPRMMVVILWRVKSVGVYIVVDTVAYDGVLGGK